MAEARSVAGHCRRAIPAILPRCEPASSKDGGANRAPKAADAWRRRDDTGGERPTMGSAKWLGPPAVDRSRRAQKLQRTAVGRSNREALELRKYRRLPNVTYLGGEIQC